MTVTIPLWLILLPAIWVIVGLTLHAIVFYTSPYRSGKENGIGRGEDRIQMIANILFWPLIAVSLPIYFHSLRKSKHGRTRS